MSKKSDIAELERRKQAIEQKINNLKSNKIPTPLHPMVINWKDVIETCVSIIKDLDDNGYRDDDDEHYVYEAVMQAVYGPDIFKWMDAREELEEDEDDD